MSQGTGAFGNCNCKKFTFVASTNGIASYVKCNQQTVHQQQLTSGSVFMDCVSIDTPVEITSGTITFTTGSNYDGQNLNATSSWCLAADCQTTCCWEYLVITGGEPFSASVNTLSYIPCGALPHQTASITLDYAQSASICISYPEMVTIVTGSFFAATGVVGKCTVSASCYPAGTIYVGDLHESGIVGYVSGSYPNQNGILFTTQSFGTYNGTATQEQVRWGFAGTVTNINNTAVGRGLTNTQALQARANQTGSMAAAFVSQSRWDNDGDWMIPTTGDFSLAFSQGATGYYGVVVPTRYTQERYCPIVWYLGSEFRPFDVTPPYNNNRGFLTSCESTISAASRSGSAFGQGGDLIAPYEIAKNNTGGNRLVAGHYWSGSLP
jgi:hypothetical protein